MYSADIEYYRETCLAPIEKIGVHNNRTLYLYKDKYNNELWADIIIKSDGEVQLGLQGETSKKILW